MAWNWTANILNGYKNLQVFVCFLNFFLYFAMLQWVFQGRINNELQDWVEHDGRELICVDFNWQNISAIMEPAGGRENIPLLERVLGQKDLALWSCPSSSTISKFHGCNTSCLFGMNTKGKVFIPGEWGGDAIVGKSTGGSKMDSLPTEDHLDPSVCVCVSSTAFASPFALPPSNRLHDCKMLGKWTRLSGE